jgi:uncharacterized protein
MDLLVKTTPSIFLRIYVTELKQHDGKLLYEWILEQARAIGIPGGSAFRAIAGYGRHGRLHEETFFELSPDLPVEVEFVATEGRIQQLLELLEKEKMGLFYIKSVTESGLVGGK